MAGRQRFRVASLLKALSKQTELISPFAVLDCGYVTALLCEATPMSTSTQTEPPYAIGVQKGPLFVVGRSARRAMCVANAQRSSIAGSRIGGFD